ncbi:hypothetical protein [Methylocystis echinoides]|uniref:Integrase SAM-like N-terminal domain-containing protein n=1 Tax=Methylocystis echinoides TaxID=29468 RepID=A0A9W6GYS2_9HYPH|nr:hypothetical protein [Methylocystis echinoides]GLI95592.1 hypothetical protein LMG27198_45840 [Methylocystis echinoides]
MAIIATIKSGNDLVDRFAADRAAVTVKEFAKPFDQVHILVRVKATTAKGYQRLLEKAILPALGRFKVIEVTLANIAKLYHDQRHNP